jgi:hypothetical protein
MNKKERSTPVDAREHPWMTRYKQVIRFWATTRLPAPNSRVKIRLEFP